MKPKKYPKVCLIIINWNGKKLLRNCLNSLFKVTAYSNYVVIVVDNGSIDNSVNFIKKNFPKIDVVTLKENKGYSGGINVGITYAFKKYHSKYVVVLNNDLIFFQKEWLSKLIEIAEKNELIAVVGSCLYAPKASKPEPSAAIIVSVGWNYYQGKVAKEVDWVMGSIMLLRSEILKKIGGFDERYNPAFYEETEFCFRCKKRGYKVYTQPTSKVYHIGSQSLKRIPESAVQFFYRNRILFFMSYFPKYYFIPRLIKDLIHFFTPKKFKALLDFYKEGYQLYKKKPQIENFKK